MESEPSAPPKPALTGEQARGQWHRQRGLDGDSCPTEAECKAFDAGFAAVALRAGEAEIHIEPDERPAGAYLKDGESVLERLQRYHKEVSSLMGLLAKERERAGEAERQKEKWNALAVKLSEKLETVERKAAALEQQLAESEARAVAARGRKEVESP